MSPPLPKLPGYTVSMPQSLSDKTFKKSQTLTYLKGYQNEGSLMVVNEAPGSADQTMSATGAAAAAAAAATATKAGATGNLAGTGAFSPSSTGVPRWVENDRKVLRFYGYFKEPVVESNAENFRIRKVVVYLYLEDDSVQVVEPKQDNSGLPQGTYIKRHKVVKEDGSLFTPADLEVGSTVSLYSRTFFLVDCDDFTRGWYTANLGIEQGAATTYPDDPINTYRSTFGLDGTKNTAASDVREIRSFIEAMLGKPSHLVESDKLKQFKKYNKKVLRFYCVWDDRSSLYGDRRPYILHFFLEDDTVEILEVHENNSGRDPFPAFLHRGPLPKSVPRTLTNSPTRVKKDELYKATDLHLGAIVSVYNRDFLLYDCDDFTRTWCKENLGWTDEELAPVDVREQVPPVPRPAMPAYNGYGSIADSIQNCLRLVPQPPPRDMHKLMNKDKIIMRFTVRFVETPNTSFQLSAADADRRFVLSYFMMDDSVLIFEPPVRNSGIVGGKFLERQQVYKPKSEDIYTYEDLYVGAVLEVFNRGFELVDADEYTLTYMENNCHIFVMADAEVVLKSFAAQVAKGNQDAVRTAFISMDTNGSGQLNGAELEAACSAAGLKATRHQLMALKRRLDKDKSGNVSIEELLHAIGA